MKKILFIISVVLFCNLTYGQIAVIKDEDGFTNVRKLPKSNSEVIYKLKNSEVFVYEESSSKTNWVTVHIQKHKYQLDCSNQNTFVGYIHKSRLKPIEELSKYKGNDFTFEYELQKFNLKNKISNFDGKYLTEINGRRFFGTDGEVPKIEVVGIKVSLNGKKIEVPEILYQDIFECNNKFIINKNQNEYIVHQWNSDGAGGYLIVWVFGNEKLKQRLIFIP